MEIPRMDVARAEELQRSALWASIVNELDVMVLYESAKLRSCRPEDLVGIQAKISALEELTRLPQNVIDRQS